MEVAQSEVASGADLECYCLAGTTFVAGNGVAVSWGDARDCDIDTGNSRKIVVRGSYSGRGRKLLEVESTSTGNGVVGCLEVTLVWQEEDNSAHPASI